MSTGYQIDNQAGLYYLTFQVVDWVDIFTRQIYRDIIIDSFDFCRREKGLELWAYVIMSNHIHLIVSAKNENLSNVVRDFKRFTSTTILKTIKSINESRAEWMLKRFEFAAKRHVRNNKYQFWTHENHAVELVSEKFIRQKMIYIHNNPVSAGWVENPNDWLYSSQRNYGDLVAKIEIDLMPL